mmetsp:Transcript_15234/g.39237  ORF Transcript_15234/g.39237 Transcript_15234/m.39237 type:complete len:230 (+) Transcript_15234:583-1272(+)
MACRSRDIIPDRTRYRHQRTRLTRRELSRPAGRSPTLRGCNTHRGRHCRECRCHRSSSSKGCPSSNHPRGMLRRDTACTACRQDTGHRQGTASRRASRGRCRRRPRPISRRALGRHRRHTRCRTTRGSTLHSRARCRRHTRAARPPPPATPPPRAQVRRSAWHGARLTSARPRPRSSTTWRCGSNTTLARSRWQAGSKPRRTARVPAARATVTTRSGQASCPGYLGCPA